jgi:hypothetical protein
MGFESQHREGWWVERIPYGEIMRSSRTTELFIDNGLSDCISSAS